MIDLRLHVNGGGYDIRVQARRTLAEALRVDCGLTGTHVGCEHGACGACTVIMDGEAIRSCLLFAVQAEGAAIRTVEGLGGSALQNAFMAHHGLQCGFCTPGFLMLATALLESGAPEQAIMDGLSANLCRCTGYQGIVDAVMSVASVKPSPCEKGFGEGGPGCTDPLPGPPSGEGEALEGGMWR